MRCGMAPVVCLGAQALSASVKSLPHEALLRQVLLLYNIYSYFSDMLLQQGNKEVEKKKVERPVLYLIIQGNLSGRNFLQGERDVQSLYQNHSKGCNHRSLCSNRWVLTLTFRSAWICSSPADYFQLCLVCLKTSGFQGHGLLTSEQHQVLEIIMQTDPEATFSRDNGFGDLDLKFFKKACLY